MSGALRAELLAYSLAKIDDTWAEASHRDVSSFSKRCPGSKVPYMAASHRKQQHLAMHDQLRRAQQARFAGMLQAHKSIGQRRAGKRRALRPAKTSRASLDSFVYIYDDASTRDWEEVMGKETLRLLPQVPRERRSAVTRLQREYLTHVLSDGMVLSLPAAAVQGPAAASGCQEYVFFQIVHKTTGQQKRGRSAASAAQQRMRYQASLQRMLSWTPPGGEASAGQRQLVLDGDPEVLDLFEFADWTAWSSSLQRWDQFGSAIAGCCAVDNGQLVTVLADWRDSSVPAWTVLKALADAGWPPGTAPQKHTLASDKHLGPVKDAVADKSYLRCLLGLPELLKGDFHELRSAQASKYYDCVLRSDNPQSVPLGLSASAYKQILQAISSGQEGQLMQMGDSVVPAPVAPICGVEFDDGVPLSRPLSSKRPAPSTQSLSRQAGEGQPKRTKVAHFPLDENWSEFMWAQMVEEGAVAKERTASGPACPPADVVETSGNAASSSDPAPPRAEASDGQEAPKASSSGQQVWVEGCLLVYETHGVLGQPGSYRRVKAKCPEHPDCKGSRTFSARLAKASGLGDQEPYAFFGRVASACRPV